MMIFNKLTSIISIVVTVAFVQSFILTEPLRAVIDLAAESRVSEHINRQIQSLLFPLHFGRVVEGNCSGGDTLVIYIQDLHCHPEVQQHIAEIISFITKNASCTPTLFLEGAPQGTVPLNLLSSLPGGEFRDRALRRLMDKGYLSGAEYFAVTAGTVNVNGLEDASLYLDNLARYRRLAATERQRSRLLETVSRSIQKLARKQCSKETLFFLTADDNDGEDNGVFYRTIESACATSGIDTNDYPQVHRYIHVSKESENLDARAVRKELGECLAALRTKLPYVTWRYFVQKMKTGDKSSWILLSNIAGEYLPDMSRRFPALTQFMDTTREEALINPLRLSYETRDLGERIAGHRSRRQVERELLYLVRMGQMYRNIRGLRAVPDEVDRFIAERNHYFTLLAKYTGSEEARRAAQLDLSDIDEYYLSNYRRDAVFSRCILNWLAVDMPPAGTYPSNNTSEVLRRLHSFRRIAVVVAGGFHSGLLKDIKRTGASYLSICPEVTAPHDPAIYRSLLFKMPGFPSIMPSFTVRAVTRGALAPPLLDLGMPKDVVNELITGWSIEARKGGLSPERIHHDIAKWATENNIGARIRLQRCQDNETFVLQINDTSIRFYYDGTTVTDILPDAVPGEIESNKPIEAAIKTPLSTLVIALGAGLIAFAIMTASGLESLPNIIDVFIGKKIAIMGFFLILAGLPAFIPAIRHSGAAREKVFNSGVAGDRFIADALAELERAAFKGAGPDLVIVTGCGGDTKRQEEVRAAMSHLGAWHTAPIDFCACPGPGPGRALLDAFNYLGTGRREKLVSQYPSLRGKQPHETKILVLNLSDTGMDILTGELPFDLGSRKATPLSLAFVNAIRDFENTGNRGGITIKDPGNVMIARHSALNSGDSPDIILFGSRVSYRQMHDQKLTLMIRNDLTRRVLKLYYRFNGEQIRNALEKKALSGMYRLDNATSRQMPAVNGDMFISFKSPDRYETFIELMQTVHKLAVTESGPRAPPFDFMAHCIIPLIMAANGEDHQAFFAKLRDDFKADGQYDAYRDYYGKIFALFDRESPFRKIAVKCLVGASIPSASAFTRIGDRDDASCTEQLRDIERAAGLLAARHAHHDDKLSLYPVPVSLEERILNLPQDIVETAQRWAGNILKHDHGEKYELPLSDLNRVDNGLTPIEKAQKLLAEWHELMEPSETASTGCEDWDFMREKALTVMQLTPFSRKMFGNNLKPSAQTYRYFSELCLIALERVTDEIAIAEKGNDEKALILRHYRHDFEVLLYYSLEYLHGLDYAANLETLGGYVYPREDTMERLRIMPANRHILGMQKGIIDSSEGLRRQVSRVAGAGNYLTPSLYSYDELKTDTEQFIRKITDRDAQMHIGISLLWKTRRTMQRFLSLCFFFPSVLTAILFMEGTILTHPFFADAGLLVTTAIVHVFPFLPVPLASFIILHLVVLGYVVFGGYGISIMLHRLSVRWGKTNHFYTAMRKKAGSFLSGGTGEMLSRLEEEAGEKLKQASDSAALPRATDPRSPVEKAGECINAWQELLDNGNTGREDFARMRGLALEIIRITAFSKSRISVHQLKPILTLYDSFVLLSGETVRRMEESTGMDAERTRFTDIYHYGVDYFRALEYVHNIDILGGYRIAMNSAWYLLLEKTRIMDGVRLVFGMSPGILLSKRAAQKKLKDAMACANRLLPGLYPESGNFDDILDGYISGKKNAEYFELGMTEGWKVRKMLTRFIPLLLVFKPIVEHLFFSVPFSWESFALFCATGVGLSLFFHWISILSIFVNVFYDQKRLRYTPSEKEIAQAELDILGNELSLRERVMKDGPMPDLVLVTTGRGKDRHRLIEKHYFQRPGKLSSVPFAFVPGGDGSGRTFLQAMSYLKSDEFKAAYPGLAQRPLSSLRIAIVNVDGTDLDAVQRPLPFTICGILMSPLNLALINAVTALAELPRGIAVMDPGAMYFGPLARTGDITLIGANVSYDQMKNERLTMMLSNPATRSVTKIFHAFNKETLVNMLAKKSLLGMFSLGKTSLPQMPAMTGNMIIDFSDAGRLEKFIDALGRIHAQAGISITATRAPPLYDLVTHLMIPLVMLANNEDPFSYSVKLGTKIVGKNEKKDSSWFYWDMFRTYEEVFKENMDSRLSITALVPPEAFYFNVCHPWAVTRDRIVTKLAFLGKLQPSSRIKIDLPVVPVAARERRHELAAIAPVAYNAARLEKSVVKAALTAAMEAVIPRNHAWLREHAPALYGKNIVFVVGHRNKVLEEEAFTYGRMGMTPLFIMPGIDTDELISTREAGIITVQVAGNEILALVTAGQISGLDGDRLPVLAINALPGVEQVTTEARDIVAQMECNPHYTALFNGRAALSCMRELQDGKPEFNKAAGEAGVLPPVGFNPAIVRCDGSHMMFALPSLIADDSTHYPAFQNTVFSVAMNEDKNAPRMPDLPLSLCGMYRINPRVFIYNVVDLPGGKQGIDITRCGLILADAITMQTTDSRSPLLNIYPEIAAVTALRHPVSFLENPEKTLRTDILMTLAPAYAVKEAVNSARNRSGDGITPARTAYAAMVSFSRYSDLKRMAHILKDAGITTLALEHLMPVATDEFGLSGMVSGYALDPKRVDWRHEAEQLHIHRADRARLMYNLKSVDTDDQNYFYEALQCYNHFCESSIERGRYDKYYKSIPGHVQTELEKWAKFMAASRINGYAPSSPEDIKKAQRNAPEKWAIYPGLYRYMHYVAQSQLKEALQTVDDMEILFTQPARFALASVDAAFDGKALVAGETAILSGVDENRLLACARWWFKQFDFNGIVMKGFCAGDDARPGDRSVIQKHIADTVSRENPGVIFVGDAPSYQITEVKDSQNIYSMITLKGAAHVPDRPRFSRGARFWVHCVPCDETGKKEFEAAVKETISDGIADFVSFSVDISLLEAERSDNDLITFIGGLIESAKYIPLQTKEGCYREGFLVGRHMNVLDPVMRSRLYRLKEKNAPWSGNITTIFSMLRTAGITPEVRPDIWDYLRHIEKETLAATSSEADANTGERASGFIEGLMDRSRSAKSRRSPRKGNELFRIKELLAAA